MLIMIDHHSIYTNPNPDSVVSFLSKVFYVHSFDIEEGQEFGDIHIAHELAQAEYDASIVFKPYKER